MALVAAATAGTSLLLTTVSSSSSDSHSHSYSHSYSHLHSHSLSQTLCEEAAARIIDSKDNNKDNDDDIVNAIIEPEIDPYDNLPEKDEPTHCSICLTYRQGPCRPYWKKVEACTKDNEAKEKKKDDDDVNDDVGKNKDNDDDPSSPSTRCFKYMMPWIDCASKYRNLYTLIEMDTNYTEGIEELEATSRHFCWMPGKEPKIDWNKWQQFVNDSDSENSKEKEEEEQKAAAKPSAKKDTKSTDDTNADATACATDDAADTAVAMWKTLDPALGDPVLITIGATVPATIADTRAGPGVMECAYAVDQDNNVIGFAYGTKPSDLMTDENDNAIDNKDEKKNGRPDSDKTTNDNTTNNDNDNTTTASGDDGGEKMIPININLVVSRTREFVLAASYTHRLIEGGTAAIATKTTERDNSNNNNGNVRLVSHLYKSKSFSLADVPKIDANATSQPQPTLQKNGEQ